MFICSCRALSRLEIGTHRTRQQVQGRDLWVPSCSRGLFVETPWLNSWIPIVFKYTRTTSNATVLPEKFEKRNDRLGRCPSDIPVSLVRNSSAPRNSRPEQRVTRKRIREVNSLSYGNWYTRHLGRSKVVVALNNRHGRAVLNLVTFERELWFCLGLAAVWLGRRTSNWLSPNLNIKKSCPLLHVIAIL